MSTKRAKSHSSVKSALRTSDGKSRQHCRSISAIMRELRKIFPSKTGLNIRRFTKVSDRTAERWLSGESEPSASALVDLLRSEIGREVLFAAMGDARPEWFSKYAKQLDLNDTRRRAKELLRLAEQQQDEVL
ncbi:hypothetical protein LPW26_03395 [Rhodopseudomonas sp. HC1]|uniref:hypothetical protein n=1 Tax=Rhodopseudomonas infernalis TaxID=2897386 RepID=UPI001EE875A4|nr:hypothetical protein [Rhodopseudomonas infernalis]MCG6203671.1 hypothetical protein [Rhodopseudomonas infernalis]